MQRYLYQKNELMDCGTSCRKVFLKYAGIAHLARHKGSFMSDQSHSSLAPDGKKDKKTERVRDITRAGEALAASEVVSRYGCANAEFIKGYSGVDNTLGQKLHDGLKTLSQKGTGLAQKAGTAAEILATNRDNAENIIDKISQRSARTDDLSRQYGVNHSVVDRVQISEDGTVSYAQMKFESNHKLLVDKIVKKDGEYAKYLNPKDECTQRAEEHFHHAQKSEAKARLAESQGRLESAAKHRQNAEALRVRGETNEKIGESQVQLEVPTEQVAPIKKTCLENANKCRAEAAGYEKEAVTQESLGNLEQAKVLRGKAQESKDEAVRNEQLEKQVVDSGVSQNDANLAASQPLKVTVTSIIKTSHRAGIEGAKMGAIVGSSISVLQNSLAFYRGDADVQEFTHAVLIDTTKAAAMGYGGAFAGSAIKGAMQQSSSAGLRAVAKTNLPALVVSTCASLSGSITRYVQGEISEADLLTEVGEKGAGMLSSSMMAAVGQLAIPIPVVGAVIGGMVGATLSSFFYQSALDAARGAQVSREVLERTRAIEGAARARMAQERATLQQFIDQELPQLRQETQQLLAVLDAKTGSSDDFAAGINRYAELLGVKLAFNTQSEFNAFIASGQTLRL